MPYAQEVAQRGPRADLDHHCRITRSGDASVIPSKAYRRLLVKSARDAIRDHVV